VKVNNALQFFYVDSYHLDFVLNLHVVLSQEVEILKIRFAQEVSISLGRRKMAPPRCCCGWTTVTMLLMGFVMSTSLAQDMTTEEQKVSLSRK